MVAARSLAPAFAALALVAGACAANDTPIPTDQDGTVGGRVLMTLDGPLVGADVSIDLLEFTAATVVVRSHLGDTTTDAEGHFEMLTGHASGYFLITTRGGQFRDYATGQTVALDPTDELSALLYTDLLEDLTTGLVTPITHLAHRLIVARTTSGADATLVDAHALVNEHLDAHFGGLRWERIAPGSLAAHATSPTAEIRAAFVLAAWSYMARDIAAASGASVQEVNPYTLAIALGKDLDAPPFDGNDGNDRAAGTGLQLGACPADACIPSGGGCNLGECRSACDAFAGTPRTTLAAAVTYLINDNGPTGRNQTGLSVADALSFARAIATNTDPILFGDACIDELDRVRPALVWGATPADGAIVRGAVAWTVHALDNVDPHPVVTLGSGLVDTDGTPDGAAATVDTSGTDQPYTITATATDAAGNTITESRSVLSDNTPPTVAVDPADPGFLIDGSTWWTTSDAPTLRGTASDLHGPITIEARILGQVVATVIVPSGPWQLTLPAGSVAATCSTVAIRATDAPGNASVDGPANSPFVRIDHTPPTIDGLATTFVDESKDIIAPGLAHTHSAAPIDAVTLGTAALPVCPIVKKYAYRTAAAPVGSETPANPIALAVRASDSGIGLDPSGTSYVVTAPSGAASASIALASAPAVGAPGAYDSTADLRRERVPTIGDPTAVEEGVFTVTFTVHDRLGQAATLTRCFTYAPLGPPLQVTTGPRLAVRGMFVKTLVEPGTTPGTYVASADYALPNGPTSALLNGTAEAGILELWVTNATPDPAYVTVTAPTPPAPSYATQIVTYLEATTQQTVSGPSCDIADPPPGEDPLCAGDSPAPLATTNTSGPIAASHWTPYIGLLEVNSAGTAIAGPMLTCPGCAADQRMVAGNGGRMAIVVGAAGIADLHPDVPGPYREVSGDFTGAVAPGAPTVKRCIAWGPVVGTTRTCTRIQNYRQNRTIQSATVTLSEVAGTLIAADWTSRAFPAAVATSPAPPITARRLITFPSWITTEN